jgi:PAS domain S-box-containing protein
MSYHNLTNGTPDFYQEIVDPQRKMICRYTPTFTLLFVNQAYAEYYGKTPADMVGSNILEMIAEVDRPKAMAFIQQFSPQNPVQVSENRSLRPDGSTRWLEWTDCAFFDASGTLIEIQGIGRDITAQKLLQTKWQHAYDVLEQRLTTRITELKHAKARVEAVLNHSFDAVFLAHADLSIQQTNPAFNHLFRCNVDDYFGRSILALVHADSIPLMKETIATVMAAHSGQNIEAWLCRLDGTCFPAELSFGYIKGLDDDIDGMVCTLRDITQRKEQEKQLRYHASLQENVNDAVIATDMEFRIQSWNPAAETIYGWHHDEVLGQSVTAILQTRYATEEERTRITTQFMDEGWWHGEVTQSCKDGSQIHILSSVTLLRDDHSTPLGIVAVNRDITERKKFEETLFQTLEREKELNEMKSRFVSMASHEFRTPLTIILSSAETILRYRQKLSEEQQTRRLHIITEQVHHLTDLVTNVLDLERIRSGRTQLRLAEVDLVAFCHEMIEDFQSQLNMTHSLVLQHDADCVHLPLDKSLMRQVLTNLISNAIKYSPNAQPVTIGVQQVNGTWQLSVRDEGIGIPPADLLWLFEPFHRASNVDKIPGNGLGLSITKQIVEMHGGHITVESHLNSGTTFCIHLPLPT